MVLEGCGEGWKAGKRLSSGPADTSVISQWGRLASPQSPSSHDLSTHGSGAAPASDWEQLIVLSLAGDQTPGGQTVSAAGPAKPARTTLAQDTRGRGSQTTLNRDWLSSSSRTQSL